MSTYLEPTIPERIFDFVSRNEKRKLTNKEIAAATGAALHYARKCVADLVHAGRIVVLEQRPAHGTVYALPTTVARDAAIKREADAQRAKLLATMTAP